MINEFDSEKTNASTNAENRQIDIDSINSIIGSYLLQPSFDMNFKLLAEEVEQYLFELTVEECWIYWEQISA
jgi:hypothetical protein